MLHKAVTVSLLKMSLQHAAYGSHSQSPGRILLRFCQPSSFTISTPLVDYGHGAIVI